MVDRTDPLDQQAELDAIIAQSSAPATSSAESAGAVSEPKFQNVGAWPDDPDYSGAPRAQDALDDVAATQRLEQVSDTIPKLRDGLTGAYGVAEPGAETETAIKAAERDLKSAGYAAPAIFSLSPLDIVKGLLGFGANPVSPEEAAKNPAKALVGQVAGEALKNWAEGAQKDQRAAEQALEAIKKDPSIGITYRGDWTSLEGLRKKATGTSRQLLDSAVQSFVEIPANVPEYLGIGANIAGWALSGGERPIEQDNSLRAVARWAKELSRSYFPGDVSRQHEFSTNLVRGLASTAGFMNVHGLSKLALKITNKNAAYITAAIGGMANAPGTYEEAIQSRREGRDVADLTLALAFGMGTILGWSEAAPIARNLPLPPGTKSKILSYLSTMFREAAEEGGQEFGQAVGENLIAMMHDPNRSLEDGSTTNMLIGMISGGSLQAARLGLNHTARIESIAQSRLGVDQAQKFMEWREAKLGGGAARIPTPGSPGPAAPSQPAAPEPPEAPGQAPNLAPAPSGRSTTIDLDQYVPKPAGDYPIPAAPRPFDAGTEFAPSARIEGEAAAGGGMVAATEPPTFDDLIQHPNFPRDEFNDIDVKAFQDTLESVTGKRFYNQLTPEEKFAVAQTLATGVVPASGEAAAVAGQTATRAGAAAATGGEQPASAPIARPKEEQRYIDRMRISGGPSTEGLSDDQLAEQYRTKWASRAQPTVQAAPQPTVGEAPAPSQEEQAVFAFRDAGANSEWLDRAMQIPPIAGNTDLAGHEALQGDVELTFDVAQEDGTIDQETMVMPAVDALTMIDRRLKGIALLLGCVG